MEETSKKVRHTQQVTEARSKPDGKGRVMYYEMRTVNGSYIGTAIANENPLPGDDEITLEDAKKNAYLWASAPSLLEALESVVSAFDISNEKYADWTGTHELYNAIIKVKEAIKLAK